MSLRRRNLVGHGRAAMRGPVAAVLATLCLGWLAAGPAAALTIPRTPAGLAAVVNVRDLGAKGDGVTDDTAALLAILSSRSGIVYLPAGVYVVSDTLRRRLPNGNWKGGMILLGDGRDRTFIKLRDRLAAFADPDHPRPVVQTASYLDANAKAKRAMWLKAGEGNEAYDNFVGDLTIDTGAGNPGAIGLDFLANNGGAVRGLTIRSSDGRGRAGLSMARRWPGPAFVADMIVEGFDYGIAVDHREYGMTLEHITLHGQRIAAIRNSKNVLSIRGLHTNSAVPAIVNVNNGLVALVDGTLEGGSAMYAAILNDGQIYLRNVTSTGYRSVVAGRPGTSVSEYVSHSIPGSRPLPEGMKRIAVEDTPSPPADPGPWASVTDFGAKPNDRKDDRAAIQAAIDSGAGTVYFPTGQYFVSGPIELRGNVRRVLGMYSGLASTRRHVWTNAAKPQPVFHVGERAQDAVWIESFFWSGREGFPDSPALDAATQFVRLDAARTVVMKDVKIFAGMLYASNGRLFIENLCCPRLHLIRPNRTWIRQLDAEGRGVGVLNDGADLWVLGVKTEGPLIVVATSGGGRTEVVGGLVYPAGPVPRGLPAFINEGSYQSLVYAESAYRRENLYAVHARDSFGGKTHILRRSDLPRRGLGVFVPLWSAYPPAPDTEAAR